jgi:hypothetical protein
VKSIWFFAACRQAAARMLVEPESLAVQEDEAV